MILTPESFGAIGDGKHLDGHSFYRLITFVNNIGGSEAVHIQCRGRYLITGGPNLDYPFGSKKELGKVRGLLPILRENVHIDAKEAIFHVPRTFHWRRTKRGGDKNDHFACGWHFIGSNCSMTGGTMNGNLANRTVIRGPKMSNFGGQEFGLIMQGLNWKLTGVVSKNWGTDCLNIGAPGVAVGCDFIGGRRNSVSVVPRLRVLGRKERVIIEGCRMHGGGDWPDRIRNRPGAGLDIEGIGNEIEARVTVTKCNFHGNKEKDLQVSRNAVDCIVQDCKFSNDIKFQPEQKGGHVLIGNTFNDESTIKTIYGQKSNKIIVFVDNHFECEKKPPFRQRVIKSLQKRLQGQRVYFYKNSAINWIGTFAMLPIFKKGSHFIENCTKK